MFLVWHLGKSAAKLALSDYAIVAVQQSCFFFVVVKCDYEDK